MKISKYFKNIFSKYTRYPHASQISDLSFYFATPIYRRLLKVYYNIIYILYYNKNIINNIFIFILSIHTPHAFFN